MPLFCTVCRSNLCVRPVKRAKAAYNISYTQLLSNLEVTPRFELGNEGFADPCLTTWLCHRMEKGAKCLLLFHLWSGRRGSNSLPPPWQGGALPDELQPHIWFFALTRFFDSKMGYLPLRRYISGRNRFFCGKSHAG